MKKIESRTRSKAIAPSRTTPATARRKEAARMKSKASITGTLIDEDLQMDLWTDVCIALQSLVSVGHQVGYVIQDDVNEYYGNETLRLGQALAKLWNAHATLLRLATYLECPLEEEEFFSREHCERLCEKSKASSQAFTDQLSESVNRMEKMRPAEIRRSAK
jgi:hypothetical protein